MLLFNEQPPSFLVQAAADAAHSAGTATMRAPSSGLHSEAEGSSSTQVGAHPIVRCQLLCGTCVQP